MAVAMIGPKFYAWDRNGKPLAFGKLYTYQARTNTPKPTYQSEDQVVENTNPVTLNGEGYANIYLSGSYKMVLKDDKDNEIWSADPVSSSEPSEWVLCLTANYVNPSSFSVNGNFVEQYEQGRRVRIDNNLSSYSYATIRSSVFAAGETTVTVDSPVVTTGIVESCISIVGPESSSTDEVLNIKNINVAQDATFLKELNALNLMQRKDGFKGSGMWDVVLTSSVTPNGRDIVSSNAIPELSFKLRIEEVLETAQYGIEPEQGIPSQDQTEIFDDAIGKTKSSDLNLNVAHGNFLVKKLDLTDLNVGTFKGYGIDSTQFYCSENIGSGAFVDAGLEGISSSNIQFADIGGFSTRSNGFDINYAVSFDLFRRSEANNIRVYGNDSADELENGFKINDSWNSYFGFLFSQNHYGNGFEFSTQSLNALTMMNPTASTQRPNAKNFFFDGPNTVVLISPSSEGSPARGFDFGSNVRSVTLINPHTEGDNGAFFKTGGDNNGMCINIIGGASFNAEVPLNFTGNFERLMISGYTMYDIDDLNDLVINLSAKNIVIDNLMAVENTTKIVATEKQILDAIVLTSNVESCVINGVDIAKLYRREEFSVTIDPGNPQILQSLYVDSMVRRVGTLFASQRTSSSFIGHLKATVTITEDDTINVDDSTARNGSTALVIDYDVPTKMLTIDGAIAGTCRVILEHNRV